MPKAAGTRGFTLIELMVVIAIVALLVTVMVPVVTLFMRGRGLRMAGNSFQGYFAFVRSEALNTRQPHLIVAFPEQTTLDAQGPVGGRTVGPGLVAFRLDESAQDDAAVVVFVKEFNFADQLGGDVEFASGWVRRANRAAVAGLSDRTSTVNSRFRNNFKLLIRTDGRVQIPDDKPGYLLDVGSGKGLDADLVLEDPDRFLFIDINPATGNIRTSEVMDKEDTDYPR